jgi:uncharacterized protein (TIGR03437 family)
MSGVHAVAGLLLTCSAWAQLIPPGTPVPLASKPPVVFINGYQSTCPGSFSGTFGTADTVLQSNGEVSLFFDNCSLPSSASIEDLGVAFGKFLSGLRYQDGQPVRQVDVVMHSMGGLILRSYLSGKQNTAGLFQPPPSVLVRKAIFLATPNFGTGIGLLFSASTQVDELTSGSRFLFDLATWNQGADDLRGVDAVAAAGNAGQGLALGTVAGFDDGVVPLTSASLRFYLPGRTRVLPFCHIDGGGIITLAGLCSFDAKGIANIDSPTHPTAQIIVSFLNGTEDWKNVGKAPEQDPFLSVDGGLLVAARTNEDAGVSLTSVTVSAPGQSKQLNLPSANVAYTDLFPAGSLTLTAVSASLNVSNSVTLPASGTEAFTLKPGPLIARVFPAAASLFPLGLAPRILIAIYGADLASQTALATKVPLPVQLADTQVLVSGSPIPLIYVSPAQIDAVIPANIAGLVPLTVHNNAGSHTVNIWIETAAPAMFTQDSSGTGPVSALKARDQSLVTAGNPLHAGDSVELFATGLGATTARNGLEYANQQPSVVISGADCPVTFAGAAPGFIGLDQINCIIPAGLAPNLSAPVVITSGDRTSNTASLAID